MSDPAAAASTGQHCQGDEDAGYRGKDEVEPVDQWNDEDAGYHGKDEVEPVDQCNDADEASAAVCAVLDHVVDEFLQLTVGNVDRRTAQQYLINHHMDLDAALGAYFDQHEPH